jgi:hypothetical protein
MKVAAAASRGRSMRARRLCNDDDGAIDRETDCRRIGRRLEQKTPRRA